MVMMVKDFVWSEKYRPNTIDECILPADLKKTFKSFQRKKEIPNIIFRGPAGTGKTTVAQVLVESIGAQWLLVPASLDRGLDTIRGEVEPFASTVSLADNDTKKYVIFDEADYLNVTSTQPALRNFINEYSANCGFIFTCNYYGRLLPALHSRMPDVSFEIPKAERLDLMKAFMKRLVEILKAEGVEFDAKVVGNIMLKYFPDYRRTIGELQLAAEKGPITRVPENQLDKEIDELIPFLRDRDYLSMRKWVSESGVENDDVYRAFFDKAHKIVDDPAMLVVLIGEYSYKQAFVMDHELHLAAFFSNVMRECNFNE